jgi:hypothetical protein
MRLDGFAILKSEAGNAELFSTARDAEGLSSNW